MPEYDIITVSDLRLSGGTTASMAEEIRAQAAAGYRTALLHLDSPVAGTRGVSTHLTPLIDEGLTDLVLAGDEVHARHAIVRHPLVAQNLEATPRSVAVDGVSLIANYPARTAAGTPLYQPEVATMSLARWFGRTPVLRPIGPVVREQLTGYPGIELAADDWTDLIDVSQWAVSREGGVRGKPVLGRHTRPDPDKWPDTAAEILAAYPESDDVVVRILGGADPARTTLGRIPASWLVESFGARSPAGFLASLDFFVFYHHHRWVEPLGRSVMEALASGAVAILPDYMRDTFGDAAVYAPATGVRGIVAEMSADRDAYRAQSKLGQDIVASRHNHGVHRERLAALIGRPLTPGRRELDLEVGDRLGSPATSPHTSSAARPRRNLSSAPGRSARVLFISSNGTGMGHLIRLLAMATRASERIEPFFLSLSSAVPVVKQFGFGWEYCPSRDELDVPSSEWNPFFARRFTEVVRRFSPRALIFDGTWPYAGLGTAKVQFPDLLYVWSRRSMWHKGHRTDSLAKASWFDLIVEPGEFAAEFDKGPTVGRTDAERVGPITLIDRADMLSREDARAELGMNPDEVAVLVTLGSSSDVGPDLAVIAQEASHRPGWQVYTTRAAIRRTEMADHHRVGTISRFPLARYLQAFDIGVVACGYNTYHEALLAGLPSIFVPYARVTDDQDVRARYAEHAGVGVYAERVTAAVINQAFDRLADPVEAERIRATCRELHPGNGAAAAMKLVEQLLTRHGVIT